MVQNMRTLPLPEAPIRCESEKPPAKPAPLGNDWLAKAREFMLSGSSEKTKQLIGKLYKAGEKIADKSPSGLYDKDARSYFKAYSQAIDAGKHGNQIDLPEHLRKQVGMQSP